MFRCKLASAFAAVFAISLTALTAAVGSADPDRQGEVAIRGAIVMPFDLKATTHFFVKTLDGGVQRVVVQDSKDRTNLVLIRRHLREIVDHFRKGDFSAVVEIHGDEMPGLRAIREARPGLVRYSYRDISNGGELRYATSDPALVKSLHIWFDAQVSDHGHDAQMGDMHSGMTMP